MKNASTLFTVTFLLALFSVKEVNAQFDSSPFKSIKQSDDHKLMYQANLGAGFMKDEFYQYDIYNPNSFDFSTRYHLFYKAAVGAYYPAVKIGNTGSFGPTLGASIGFTRRQISTVNVPLGMMIRFGNNSTVNTKKAWGYGLGIAIAPTLYFERDYNYGGSFLKEPMLCAELSTQKVSLRLDVLPFPMEKKSLTNSKIIFDSDVSLTMSYSFDKINW